MVLRRTGQALIEFAAVLPVLLLLTIGMINLGLLMAAQLELTQAAWEGARAGATIVEPSIGDAEIMGAVDNALFLLDPGLLAVAIDPGQDDWPRNAPWPEPRGHPLQVSLSYPFPLYLPGALEIQLQARAVSRMEYQNP